MRPADIDPLAGSGIRYLEVRTLMDWPGRPLVSARAEYEDGTERGVVTWHEEVAVAQLASRHGLPIHRERPWGT